MDQVIYDKVNGELRTITDYFAQFHAYPMCNLPPGVQTGSHVSAGDVVILLKVAGQPDIEVKAPQGCTGTINGIGNWSEEFSEPPSKVLLYIHPDG
ncbi:MAG: hypothetical protein WBP56_19080 [Polyangia bacterium]